MTLRNESWEEKVASFMRKHDQPTPYGPSIPDDGCVMLRTRLMIEELAELVEGMHEQDLLKIADALGDLIYVVVGAAVAYGMPLGLIVNEVHASNMTKPVLNRHGKGGKIKKDGFRPPNLTRILKEADTVAAAMVERDRKAEDGRQAGFDFGAVSACGGDNTTAMSLHFPGRPEEPPILV